MSAPLQVRNCVAESVLLWALLVLVWVGLIVLAGVNGFWWLSVIYTLGIWGAARGCRQRFRLWREVSS